ncbi:hypothetical protein [Fusobacterium sp. PH5-44]|uniref:hypothetical protein n=1 Tax=unclassified Fusobacterium TaxID=2648384 RepID=UPI003D2159E1
MFKRLISSIFLGGIIILAGQTVYVTPNGKKYHSTKNCRTLARSKVINSINISKVAGRGPCKVCH